MAWEVIGGLVNKERSAVGEIDGRFLIERLLRGWLKSEEVWCEYLRGGAARVRVGSGLLQQEAMVKEYDVRLALRGELGLELKEMDVYQG